MAWGVSRTAGWGGNYPPWNPSPEDAPPPPSALPPGAPDSPWGVDNSVPNAPPPGSPDTPWGVDSSSSGSGWNGGQGPPNGSSPPSKIVDPLDAEMAAFRKLLDELNPRFRGVADELQGIAAGNDPRFEAFRQMQLGDASARNAEFFGRRGTGGSTAALNQLQRTTTGINANIGIQELQRQDQARMQSLDVLRGFLENETVPIQLQLQRMAAQNAATAAEMAGQQRDPFIKLGPISIG